MKENKKTLYLVVLSAIYGMLEASMLFHKKLRDDLEAIGFAFNPYEPCVCNRIIRGNQHTVRFHVDDLLSSHVDGSVNDKFAKWLNEMYGKHGKKVKVVRGNRHQYLGMSLEFISGKNRGVKITMHDHVNGMVDGSPFNLSKCDTALTPASKKLFEVGNGKESDWSKLKRLIMYLNGTRKKGLFLRIDEVNVIKWWADASFGVHPDFKSHTGAMMSMGGGAFQSFSKKQKLNTRSSNESELVALDDVSVHIMWTKLLLEHQGYRVDKNIVYQDNRTSMLLEINGLKSAGKRSRAINLRYFWMTDQMKKRAM